MMAQNPSDAELFQQQASFIQHSLPGLETGLYSMEVHQTLLDSDNKDITLLSDGITAGLPSVTRLFGVGGPRFLLDQSFIESVFPPQNGAGDFSCCLPHVVLSSETLPWLRSPYTPDNPLSGPTTVLYYQLPSDKKQVAYDDDRPGWLAILLLSADDFDGIDPAMKIKQGTVKDLVSSQSTLSIPGKAAVQGKMIGPGYSQFSYLLEDTAGNTATGSIDPGVGQHPDDVCRYIDIPCATFNIIAPSCGDLAMMAHVRKVDISNKPIASGQTVDAQQDYALVMGNRLPDSMPEMITPGDLSPAAGLNTAVLVSLECMEYALRGHKPGSYYDTKVVSDPGGFVRLAVLYQWSFTSRQDSSFEFETILKALNGRDPKSVNGEVPVKNPSLRLPKIPEFKDGKDDQTVVADMLASGYIPMEHQARIPSGDQPNEPSNVIQTVSWYRGPLIPDKAFDADIAFAADTGSDTSKLFFSADALLRFDPLLGMYDVSYAVAWELGRLLALQNKDFSIPLYRWKKRVALAYSQLHQDKAIRAIYTRLLERHPRMERGPQKTRMASPGAANARKDLQYSLLQYLARSSKKFNP